MAKRSQGGPGSLAHVHPTESGGTLVLVSQDGIQRPPLHFPQGGHLLSFLSCLENGLLPRGQLEPPLWTQQGKVPQGLEHSGVKGCVRGVLCSPSFLSPGKPLQFRGCLGWDLGSDSALHRLTTHPSLRRGKCSPSYGNAAACGLWMWRRWAPGGPQTTCSGSFTPATGTSTVSIPGLIRGGREKDAQGGRGVQ